MSEHKQSPGKSEGKSSGKDISPVLRGWDYEPGTISVRKITGLDGRPKLQMRLDLGLLQMELSGRPDGMRPHGHESLLHYFESLLQAHEAQSGSDAGFALDTEQCRSLRDEAALYYQRYLSLFVLEDFPGVVRDTERNLRVLELCGRYAASEQDRLILEQYRPYITMMNTRASASLLFQAKRHGEALETIRGGLAEIREFFARFGQEEAYARCNEVKVLKRFARDIKRKMPVDPLQKLQTQLDRAVQAERYEEAARLRDEIRRRQERSPRA